MIREALYHCSKSSYAYAESETEIQIRFRTAKDDIDKVRLFWAVKFDWANKKSMEMEKLYSDHYFDYYQYNIRQQDMRIGYYFEVTKGSETLFYTEAGILKEFDDVRAHTLFFQYPSIYKEDLLQEPEWYKTAVFYQIFVERFENGDPDISPENLTEWSQAPTPHSFYGGDLEGIIQHLDYLEELGITAIYLTPIFKSDSNHKYDTIDYMEIDEHFGKKETMHRLVDGAHKKGIRIILDAVFNHCSYLFPPFQDVIKHGALSTYKDWFFIHDYPVELEKMNYDVFAMVPYMPRFNTANPKVQEYLYSVVRYWSSEFHIDGWRLDVADEPSHLFWRGFREVIKEINPEMVLIGEVWHDAMPWLMGDQFDTVMNYAVTNQAVNFFAREQIDAQEFSENLCMQLVKYPDIVNRMMFNLLDSHDTERFLFLADEKVESLMNAAAFQFGYTGVPCLYYGTEIGITGGYDPGCRRGFDWESSHWNKKLRNRYQRLIELRKTEAALSGGEIAFYSTKDLLVMKRGKGKDAIYIVINQSSQEQVLPEFLKSSDYRDLLEEHAAVGQKVPPKTAFYLKKGGF